MPEIHKNAKWFECPLCTEEVYKTWDPHRFWFHLASEHKTSEMKLNRYVYDVAIERGWDLHKKVHILEETMNEP